MTVVCGTDFSPASARAVDAAAAFAAAFKTDLLLVHALEFPGAEEAGAWSMLQAERSRAESLLAKEVARLASSGVSVSSEVGVGASDVSLIRAATSRGARLVVVGALGRRGGSLWRLGSTADRTAQTSKLPVLVVRDAEPIAKWAAGKGTLEVLVGIDRSPSADAAVSWTAEIESVGRCHVTGAHVYWPPEFKEKLGSSHAEVERALGSELKQRVSGLRSGRPFELRLLGGLGRPADHLVAMAEEAKADLVVVGAHHRTLLSRFWHGSVSRGVIDQAPMNVVCVTGPDQA